MVISLRLFGVRAIRLAADLLFTMTKLSHNIHTQSSTYATMVLVGISGTSQCMSRHKLVLANAMLLILMAAWNIFLFQHAFCFIYLHFENINLQDNLEVCCRELILLTHSLSLFYERVKISDDFFNRC